MLICHGIRCHLVSPKQLPFQLPELSKFYCKEHPQSCEGLSSLIKHASSLSSSVSLCRLLLLSSRHSVQDGIVVVDAGTTFLSLSLSTWSLFDTNGQCACWDDDIGEKSAGFSEMMPMTSHVGVCLLDVYWVSLQMASKLVAQRYSTFLEVDPSTVVDILVLSQSLLLSFQIKPSQELLSSVQHFSPSRDDICCL